MDMVCRYVLRHLGTCKFRSFCKTCKKRSETYLVIGILWNIGRVRLENLIQNLYFFSELRLVEKYRKSWTSLKYLSYVENLDDTRNTIRGWHLHLYFIFMESNIYFPGNWKIPGIYETVLLVLLVGAVLWYWLGTTDKCQMVLPVAHFQKSTTCMLVVWQLCPLAGSVVVILIRSKWITFAVSGCRYEVSMKFLRQLYRKRPFCIRRPRHSGFAQFTSTDLPAMLQSRALLQACQHIHCANTCLG